MGRKESNQTNVYPSYFGPDLDTNHLTLIVFLKDIYENQILKKVSRCHQKNEKIPRMQGAKLMRGRILALMGLCI